MENGVGTGDGVGSGVRSGVAVGEEGEAYAAGDRSGSVETAARAQAKHDVAINSAATIKKMRFRLLMLMILSQNASGIQRRMQTSCAVDFFRNIQRFLLIHGA